MTGESKFHLSIVWMILIPSLKIPFWAKLSMAAGKVYPVEMRLMFRPCSTCPHHMGNVTMNLLRRRGHSQWRPADPHQLMGATFLHIPGALFNVLAWCLGMLWLTGGPLLAAVGQNSPFPQRFSSGMGRCGCTHTSEAGEVLAMTQAPSSLQADP